MKVRKLPPGLVSRIAAGEVVERPASILKELIENSLDAGADRIYIEIRKAGKVLIKVKDNGSGMSREEAILSLERHATSKIYSDSDFYSVSTFGFRGEALPSMAAVSRLRMLTKSN
ncbi:MAG TPA: DNA mismatch repair protein MutL, partial [Euryarchaeota archaeon]|nr:DNA mismatch repair protein MutL [Euryarchaeota archaeon]